jgi:DNA-binding CsgD family transcriptional regulator
MGDAPLGLAGRETELALIEQFVAAVREPILAIAGDPGIGKSRLLDELRGAARARGYVVFEGRAAEFEGELPFGAFADALDDWLLGLDTTRRDVLAGGLAAELSGVFPAFEALAAEGRPGSAHERYRTYRAVRHLLSALAADGPVLLTLDDVHWADPGSVELLVHLLAHPPRAGVLLALGFRPAQIAAPLLGALAAAVRQEQAMRLEVAPLSRAASRKLLGAVPVREHERLYRESGGNPFFLLQLARSIATADLRPADVVRVPDGVRASLQSELAALSAPAQVWLQGAAVTGDPFEATLAARAADLGDADALDLIDELVRSRLIHPAETPGEFTFRHPIVRATVYESSSVGWRRLAHARLAVLLAARGATAAARAPHLERSALVGDLAALVTLVAAGDAAAHRAPGLAARWYAAALRLLPDRPDAEERRIALMVAQATAHSDSGELAKSRDVLRSALERIPSEHPGRLPIIASCASIEHLLGRHGDAQARLRRALRMTADRMSPGAVSLQLELASGAGFVNRYDEMLDWASQAHEGAATLGARAMTVVAAGQIALAGYFKGLPTDDALQRAAQGFDELDDDELATRLDLGLWVGWTEAVLEHHERAVMDCQRVLDVARATAQGATLLVTMTAQAWAQLRMGRLDDADATLTAALDTGRLSPHLFFSVAVGLSAVLATYRGDHGAAVRAGEECVRLARCADAGLIPGMSGLYLATPLIEMGDAERAREVILAMSRGKPELETSRSGYVAAFEILTRAEVALARLDAAAQWAQRAEAIARSGRLGAETAIARRATATVALARGKAKRAAELALDAIEHATRAGAPVESGRARILSGRALVQAGDRDGGVAALEQAAQELARIGANGYAQEAHKELRRLGRRTRRLGRATTGLGALSEREREIGELVSQGRTNRDIAATIHVSEKTVERHLSRIFSTVGVSTRTALAVLVANDARHSGAPATAPMAARQPD